MGIGGPLLLLDEHPIGSCVVGFAAAAVAVRIVWRGFTSQNVVALDSATFELPTKGVGSSQSEQSYVNILKIERFNMGIGKPDTLVVHTVRGRFEIQKDWLPPFAYRRLVRELADRWLEARRVAELERRTTASETPPSQDSATIEAGAGAFAPQRPTSTSRGRDAQTAATSTDNEQWPGPRTRAAAERFARIARWGWRGFWIGVIFTLSAPAIHYAEPAWSIPAIPPALGLIGGALIIVGQWMLHTASRSHLPNNRP